MLRSISAAIRRRPRGSARRAPRPLRGPWRATRRRAHCLRAAATKAPFEYARWRARLCRERLKDPRHPFDFRYALSRFPASVDAARLTGQRSPVAPPRPNPIAGASMQPSDRRLANAIRALAMDAVEAANSGHPGMPMGMADAATALFTRHLKFDAADPDWPDRDRFILSAGHGSMLIYSLLYLTGYARPPLDDIRRFRQLGAPTGAHREN